MMKQNICFRSNPLRVKVGERGFYMIRGKGDIKAGEVEAFLGKNSSFEGKMGFEGMARLDGKFGGEIFSGDMLIIGETATVNAEINVSTLVIDGKVSGNVSATGKIEIHATGKLYGNITTPTLVIEQGGLFDGTCKMEKEVEAKKKVTPIKEKEEKEIDVEKVVEFQDEV
jgi:cytoskeletal protein CcmA (bactofilin family)